MTLASALAVFVGLGVWVSIVVFALTSSNEFRVRLELQHREVWTSLGSPGFTRDKGSPWPIIRFLISRRYRELNDPLLTKLGNRALSGQALMLLIFVCILPIWTFGVGISFETFLQNR